MKLINKMKNRLLEIFQKDFLILKYELLPLLDGFLNSLLYGLKTKDENITMAT